MTRLALLTAVALTIFMAEAQLPAVTAVPGVKLGLANIVTVYAMFALEPRDALMVLFGRVFLAVFSGQMMTLIYSAAGGLLSWCSLLLLRKLLSSEQIWLASPAAAVFHNLGQLLAAAAVLRSWAVMAYLPYLVLAAVLAGLFTGVAAQALIKQLNKLQK
jgi:heptaprenyl diphosphate synthase